MRPHLTVIDITHRAMIADTVPEHAQIEEPRLWTTDELLWACFFTGLASVLFTCGMAWVVGRFGL